MVYKQLPDNSHISKHILRSFNRYWQKNRNLISALPIKRLGGVDIINPPTLVPIVVPYWAQKWSVEGALYVPSEVAMGTRDWKKVDWWMAAFLLLEGCYERVWEDRFGTCQSYSIKLKRWDKRIWEKAWVNRIVLFLREWGARNKNRSANDIFGPLPPVQILLTHDVDAINKTIAIRIKQATFNLLNFFRYIYIGDFKRGINRLYYVARFLFSNESWWTLDALVKREKENNVEATYFFYADKRAKNSFRWLLDPNYKINSKKIISFFKTLKENGMQAGIHPTFDSWNKSNLIKNQLDYLSKISNQKCKQSRQHWLRFSWKETWQAQELAGILKDHTLMFNDRPGFRNSAAIAWRPWNFSKNKALNLIAQPTLFMDSHFFDYKLLSSLERKNLIESYIEECWLVRGQISVLWHPHTLTKDYGWSEGFNEVLNILDKFKSDRIKF